MSYKSNRTGQEVEELLEKAGTAIQSKDLADVATSGSYNDLSNKPALFSGNYNDLSNKPTIPTNTNQLTNGAGYITGINRDMVTSALEYTPYNSSNPSGYITSSALSGYATQTWVNNKGYITTWRPLGTTADTACAGNDSRLSNARPANGGNADTVGNFLPTSFAHIAARNNFITSGNEFTFVPSGFSGDIWINFRTTGGFDGNITEYKFGNGNGGILGTAIHSGNIGSQSVNYATSAGALSSRSTNAIKSLTYYCNSGISETLAAAPDWCKPAGVGSHGNSMILRMSWHDGAFGHDIFASPNTSDLWHRATQNNTEAWKKIIDSGNIGSQSVNYATSAGNADTLDGYHFNGLPYLSTSGGTVSGIITANHFYKASDDRLKIRLQDYNVSLSVISQIPSFLFKWKDSKRGQDVMLGTSAQSLENLGLNQLVHTNTEGEKSVSYDMLGLLAISALKEVYNELNVLKQRLNLLEGR
jgi:hypothetical protein